LDIELGSSLGNICLSCVYLKFKFLSSIYTVDSPSVLMMMIMVPYSLYYGTGTLPDPCPLSKAILHHDTPLEELLLSLAYR